MDKDTKDILETVNFIKDRMATKDDLADLRKEMHEGFADTNRRLETDLAQSLPVHQSQEQEARAALARTEDSNGYLEPDDHPASITP